MKKIAFIVVWGGELPDYFQLWLESCRWNPTIDFLVFTDDKCNFDYSDNVKFYQMSFQEIKKVFQRKFDFNIALDVPYKFCDYKPAYGEIFAEYLQDYDYWGHCDIDLIWGDIRKFITHEVLDNYKRIFSRGHCSIYMNSPEVNRWYRTLSANEAQNWQTVFQSNKSCCFDEWAGHCGGGMSKLMKLNNIAIFDEVCMADINVMSGWFRINRMKYTEKDSYFHFEKGNLKFVSDGKEREFLYVHFQKRKLIIDQNTNLENFYIVAPDIITSNQNKLKRNILAEKKFEVRKIMNKIKRKLKIR